MKAFKAGQGRELHIGSDLRKRPLREHLINIQVEVPVSLDSIRQVGVDSEVRERLIVLAMTQWITVWDPR
ncbi:hypothetical protein [Streptomyces noursei]|uniref:hypothetical protein n=1 Tax=Streptomyces noursei TaxID=1971 RepID=UPI0015E06893|nr:hypothetical protein [Streptomyces noursei]